MENTNFTKGDLLIDEVNVDLDVLCPTVIDVEQQAGDVVSIFINKVRRIIGGGHEGELTKICGKRWFHAWGAYFRP
jgi:hypothetical protein